LPANASEITRMKLFDHTFASPAENLACDEALLDWTESGAGHETLRFWESPTPFVAVGYANKVATEVNVAACETRNIPILRRCSGGGTVVQGPGCLNYALVLPIGDKGPYKHIGTANQFIMRRNRTAIQSEVGNRQSAIAVRGHTDLAVGEIKFSGNSQRRHKKFLLFHGTFLLNFDLSLIGELLQMPSKQPYYRENRVHADFLANLNLPAKAIKTALRKAWKAESPLANPPLEKIASLAREKYATHEWNFKF
jgi:lipoate---protein ligase